LKNPQFYSAEPLLSILISLAFACDGALYR